MNNAINYSQKKQAKNQINQITRLCTCFGGRFVGLILIRLIRKLLNNLQKF